MILAFVFVVFGLVLQLGAANVSPSGLNLFGYLPSEEEIEVYAAETDCQCRQMCFVRPACASASFSPRTGSCHLYRRVALRGGLLPDPEQVYHVLPGRSGHGEYCSSPGDCQQPGDRCLGYSCQESEHLTCRVLKDLYGVNESGVHWGGVAGVTMPLYCDMVYQEGGWTLLLAAGGATWNTTSALWRPDDEDTPDPSRPFSIYKYADTIAASGIINGTDDFYQIDVYDVETISGGTWRVPRTESLLGSSVSAYQLTLENGRQYGGWKLSRANPVVPWLASGVDPETFVSVSQTPDIKPAEGVLLGAAPGIQKWGGVASSGFVAILIRE
ncbi:uncharacterized protein LOC122377822 [Amphibalanus amphitrite]|uniref:uncharacterized protein LOC122377822 n=1 Tax=Amphibalanus amphitrite TaxID=1232801 RepID=UPI001C8FDA39|nr:uncharacterized protein LOC122377822 [Amphibalanus amphitrite]